MGQPVDNIHATHRSEYTNYIHKKLHQAFISEIKGRFPNTSPDINLATFFNINPLNACHDMTLDMSGIQFTHRQTMSLESYHHMHALIYQCRPWKKGPYFINTLHIDGEWDTTQKLARFRRCLPDISGKRLLDIGCNNGFFLFASHALGAETCIGIDPGYRPYFQYLLLKSLIPTIDNISMHWIGIEHMHWLTETVDTYLCMGILYHRPSSQDCLHLLYNHLNTSNTLILETIIIPGDTPSCIHPTNRYQKMRHVSELPTLPLLCEWIEQTGFHIDYIDPPIKTTADEQRCTYLGVSQSLTDFLDPDDPEKTIEGYPAPHRVMIRLSRK